MTAHEEFALAIDLTTREAEPLGDVSLTAVGMLERADLQRWVEHYPEMVGPDLLLVTTEFDQWELGERRVADRLDMLFADPEGNLLVAELKRGEAPDTIDLQALKYAAYCSNLTTHDLVEEYGRYHGVSADAARETVQSHAPALEDGEPGRVRIRLVASHFGGAVTSVVLWLGEQGLDVGCVEIRMRQVSGAQAVLTARQILPPPQAEDYLVRRRRRDAVAEERSSGQRRPNTVLVLNRVGAVAPGTTITLNMDAFNHDQREAISSSLADNPAYGRATWTGRPGGNSIQWEADGNTYSPSGLAWGMLDQLGFSPGGINGSFYWNLPNGRTLWDEAQALLDAEAERT